MQNSNRKINYISLDIPEMLAISSYFLMSSFPEKKFLLYGEDSNDFEDYDIVLMPHFILPKLEDESVDLFFNSNSLSEMPRETSDEYVSQIERICKKYFMHINHDGRFVWQQNGKRITNNMGSEIIPNPARFKRIYKHPRLFATLEDKLFYIDKQASHFTYLYEKFR